MIDSPRIKLVELEDEEEAVNIRKALGNSPGTARALRALSQHLSASGLDQQIRELAIVTVAKETNCAYELHAHLFFARKTGLPRDLLDRLGDPDLENEPYPVGPVIAFVRRVARGEEVDDATYSAMRSRLGDSGIVDLMGVIGYYLFISRFINLVKIPLEPWMVGKSLPA